MAADMAFGQSDGLSQFLNGGKLTGLYVPPCRPRATNRY
jgi:hypothetical protein